jgi:hypothetical protein
MTMEKKDIERRVEENKQHMNEMQELELLSYQLRTQLVQALGPQKKEGNK